MGASPVCPICLMVQNGSFNFFFFFLTDIHSVFVCQVRLAFNFMGHQTPNLHCNVRLCCICTSEKRRCDDDDDDGDMVKQCSAG